MRTIASPIGTFSPDEAVEKLERYCREGELEKVVVGWPVTMKGERGRATDMATQFANRLRNRLNGIEVVYFDERYTSELARQSIRESGARKKKRQQKELVDTVAAAIILQNYLDSA